MSARTTATALLRRLQNGLSKPPVELVYTPHDLWPLPQVHSHSRPLNILVLDSSFNPPTLAHLALANSHRPSSSHITDTNGYDAKILLLSVRNADKSLKPSDASYNQRLEMMDLLTKDIRSQNDSETNFSSGEHTNVAIAIIDEPTFVGKSTTLHAFLRQRFATLSKDPQEKYGTDDVYHAPQLTFLLGFDTLERLVSPRYYPSETEMISSLQKFLSPPPNGENSVIVCARRAMNGNASQAEGTLPDFAQQFVASGRIIIVDIGEQESTYSSTVVRDTIGNCGLEEHGETQWRRFVPERIAEYIVKEKLYLRN